jgi:hypothetical protein
MKHAARPERNSTVAHYGRKTLNRTLSNRASTKSPISVPVSPSNALECYPCREVPLNYNRSLLFHGGDTGSTPVRDANILNYAAFQRFIACYVRCTNILKKDWQCG